MLRVLKERGLLHEGVVVHLYASIILSATVTEKRKSGTHGHEDLLFKNRLLGLASNVLGRFWAHRLRQVGACCRPAAAASCRSKECT